MKPLKGVQKGQRNEPFFEIVDDEKQDGWTWVLWSGNRVPMAQSAAVFQTRQGAYDSIKAASRLIYMNPPIKTMAEARIQKIQKILENL